MNTQENKEKPKTERERGVAENEKANYSGFPQESSDDQEDKKDIKETDRSSESDNEGGDLAGNASGNSSEEEKE